MKILFLTLSLLSLLGFQYGCSRDAEDVQQREEVFGNDDLRENDSYNQSVPVESDDEVEIDRDVLGDDEVEIND